jgi:oligopeptide transport system ATP-binding protein
MNEKKELINILDVENLATRFRTSDGLVHAVNGVSFSMKEGEKLGIVGESGCGKSVTMLSLMRLIPQPPGEIYGGKALFFGRDLLKMSNEEIRSVRGSQIAMIFQDPMTSLNPVLTIQHQLAEPMILHLGMSKRQARDRSIEMLEKVGIPEVEKRLSDYPHQFSGGMRQRVMIAMALACTPQVLIADEPTTALDVTIQAQITDLVKRLAQEFGMAIIWITHDLGVVAGMAERVLVMYAGFIVEEALVDELYINPRHPYTKALLRSLPRIDGVRDEKLEAIKGLPPDLIALPKGCPFAARCTFMQEKCRVENPLLQHYSPTHRYACWVNVETGSLQ